MAPSSSVTHLKANVWQRQNPPMLHLAPEMRSCGGDCGVMLLCSRRCLDEQILAEIDFDEDAVVSVQTMRVQDCDSRPSAPCR